MTVSNFSTEAAASAVGTAGALTITFPSVNLGSVWTGSVQIPSAPSSPVVPVKFTANDSGVPIGSWYNDQSSSNIQVLQQLSITATGLPAGSYRAFFKGMISSKEETPPFWPGPTPAPPLGTPQVLTKTASPNQAIAANSTASVGTTPASGLFPVIVGTSLEVIGFNPLNNMQFRLQWFSAVGGDATPVYTFDVLGGQLLSGLVLPNLGPFVAVTVANGGAPSSFSVTVFTGLPPIARPPIVPGGILFYSLPPLGASVVNLPPYVGPASIMMVPNNTAGFGFEILSTNYLGTLVCETRHEQGWPAGTGPFVSQGLIYLPPLINQVSITGAPAGAAISGVILGP